MTTFFNHAAIAATFEALEKPRDFHRIDDERDSRLFCPCGEVVRFAGLHYGRVLEWKEEHLPHLIAAPLTIPSPAEFDAPLEIVRETLRARRQECYGSQKRTDDQIDEAARTIIDALSLNGYLKTKGR